MTWTANPAKHEATNEHGYVIRWAENKHGTWFNAYSPGGTHIDASYNKDRMKVACEEHREKLTRQREMYAARKAAKEVAC